MDWVPEVVLNMSLVSRMTAVRPKHKILSHMMRSISLELVSAHHKSHYYPLRANTERVPLSMFHNIVTINDRSVQPQPGTHIYTRYMHKSKISSRSLLRYIYEQ